MSKEKTSSKPDLAKMETEYNALRSVADSYCNELRNQIAHILEREGIALGFPIQHRVKSWNSLSEKFDRISFYPTSVTEVQDLAGLRLILLFRRDITRVCQQIEETFTVVRKYNTQERLKDNQFGYASIHFVIEIPEEWFAVPTLTPMRGLRAEIQVRTVAQHMWAEASQSLQYKRKESVPVSVTRAIHRVSALLETVDLEFERVLEQRDSYRTEVDVGGTDGTLNVDLLEKTLDAILPPLNKYVSEDYAALLEDLAHFGVTTAEDLKTLINKHLEAVLKVDRSYVLSNKRRLAAGEHLVTTTPKRTQAGVFFTHTGLTRETLSKEFLDLWDSYQTNKHYAGEFGELGDSDFEEEVEELEELEDA